jgi:serine/threonine protein kinase
LAENHHIMFWPLTSSGRHSIHSLLLVIEHSAFRLSWFLESSWYFGLCQVLADANLFPQLSHLEYIHSHNFIHGDIKPQNVLVGLNESRQTAFIIDFGIAKRYWNSTTKTHMPFCWGWGLTGTPAFASINNHLGLDWPVGMISNHSHTCWFIYCAAPFHG